MSYQISILGGGIAGLTTAIALNRIGYKPVVFESAPRISAVGAGLGLGANAVMAFDRLGLKEEVIERGRILDSFAMLDQQGRPITRVDTGRISERFGIDNFTIHRGELHQLLLSKLDPATIFTDKRGMDLERNDKGVKITFADGTLHETDFLIVADGVHSAIRQKLVPGSVPRYAGYTCWRSVIEDTGGDLTESSETWGKGGRFGIVPLAKNKLYWFACVNGPRNSDRFRNYRTDDLLNNFRDYHQPIPAILQRTEDENLLWNDIIDVPPLARYAFGRVLLIGDAAHATTPNMGQGACQAIEDAVVIADELQKGENIPEAFNRFERRRLKRTHYIINTSRRLGKMAQLEHPAKIRLRNFLFRRLPSRVNEKQLERLYRVDF